jgi:hypothetical protein
MDISWRVSNILLIVVLATFAYLDYSALVKLRKLQKEEAKYTRVEYNHCYPVMKFEDNDYDTMKWETKCIKRTYYEEVGK